MKLALVSLGVLAWFGVAVLAVLMAEWEEPVLGYFPIIAAVLIAWAVGGVVSQRLV
jgi:hypothetical protein